MAQYSDGVAGDVNSNADNYWAFITGQKVSGTMEGLENYSFRPLDMYETNFAVRDGEGNASAGDGDYAIHTRASGNAHPNDGVAFGGTTYWVTHAWVVEAELQYLGQTETVTARAIVARIRTADSTDDPLNGTAVIRFDDLDMQEIINGPDGGPDGNGYPMSAIESVTLANVPLNELNNINIGNRYDDPYPVICFTRGTDIRTEEGLVCVENLKVGDMVLTRDDGLQPIRWIGARRMSSEELAAAPHLRPIRIRAGALGVETPVKDLFISPQHRILIRSKIARRMFGTDEVLVAAKQLLEVDGIEIAEDMAKVEYIHFLFERHEVIYANGAEAESLYTGPEALRALSPAAREEIIEIFPELRDTDSAVETMPSARILVSGRQGRQLAHRHSKNDQALVF